MFPSMLRNANPLVKYPAAAAIIFLPLYIASSYGMKTASILAMVIFVWFLIKTSNQLTPW